MKNVEDQDLFLETRNTFVVQDVVKLSVYLFLLLNFEKTVNTTIQEV